MSGSQLFPPNIYIVGAQCTGKTTLVNALQNYFATRDNCSRNGLHISPPGVIKEVARDVLKQHNFTANDITSSKERALSLQGLILKAQSSAEKSIETGWFISDRSGLDPIAYASRYVGDQAKWDLVKSAEWVETRERMRQALVILCEPDMGWLSNDGVRLMPENGDDWIKFHRSFFALLDDVAVGYKTLPATVSALEDRVKFVIKCWAEPNLGL